MLAVPATKQAKSGTLGMVKLFRPIEIFKFIYAKRTQELDKKQGSPIPNFC